MSTRSVVQEIPPESRVVAKAVLRAAGYLGMTPKLLSETIGISETSLSRMGADTFLLTGKPFELALMVIRLYRSLDAIVGGDHAVAKAWMTSRNTALNATPIELIRTILGLSDVILYLDARRAVI